MTAMPQIRPVSDLRNKFAEISRIVNEEQQPIFLTKNGAGNMVVMSMEQYEKHQFDMNVYHGLKEADAQAKAARRTQRQANPCKSLK